MQIVAFGGLAQAGKTSAMSNLAQWAFDDGYHVERERFAGPLKDASELLGFSKGGPYDEQYRTFCQYTGEMARAITPDWWVRLLQTKLFNTQNREQTQLGQAHGPWHETLVIIDDVRYPNEIELVSKWGGICVFVDANRRLTDLDAEWRKHESEQMATDYTLAKLPDELFDYRITNNGTLPQLTAAIVNAAPEWCGQSAGDMV